MRKEFEDDEDDGETIVDMNVDGMPWYDPGLKAGKKIPAGEERGSNHSGRFGGQNGQASQSGENQFTDEEVRLYRGAAIKAALTVAAIFGGVFAAFIAFLDFVVFR